MKKYIKVIAVAVVIAIVIAGVYFANQKYDFLPASITDFFTKSNSNSIDTSNYKYVSEIDDEMIFTEYFDMKVPQECYIPSKEIVKEKYNVFADTVVLTMENTDILIQPYNIDAENTKEFLERTRTEVIATSKESMPTVTFNEGKTFNVNGKVIPIMWFMTSYKEQTTYTDIAFLEVNGKLLTVTMNSANDYLITQEMFVAIINTIKAT